MNPLVLFSILVGAIAVVLYLHWLRRMDASSKLPQTPVESPIAVPANAPLQTQTENLVAPVQPLPLPLPQPALFAPAAVASDSEPVRVRRKQSRRSVKTGVEKKRSSDAVAASSSPVADVRDLLKRPGSLVRAFLLREILDVPASRRNRAKRAADS